MNLTVLVKILILWCTMYEYETLQISTILKQLVKSHVQKPYSFSSGPRVENVLSKSSCSFKVDNIVEPERILNQETPRKLKYSIRPASYHEVDLIAKFRIHVFYPQYIAVKSFLARTIEKLRCRIDRGSICLVARSTDASDINVFSSQKIFGTLLGTVEISPNDFINTSMEHVGPHRKLYAADLAVRHDCRRQGIASSLLKEIENFAVNNNYHEIFLHVEVGNMIARNVYKTHGYKEYPVSEAVVQFTEARLQKPVEYFTLLSKKVGDELQDSNLLPVMYSK